MIVEIRKDGKLVGKLNTANKELSNASADIEAEWEVFQDVGVEWLTGPGKPVDGALVDEVETSFEPGAFLWYLDREGYTITESK